MQSIKVKSLTQLKKMASKDGGEDFTLLLNFGLRSSKHISYDKDEKRFYVFNEIDGSEQTLTDKQIMNNMYTNIGEGIRKGAFLKLVY